MKQKKEKQTELYKSNNFIHFEIPSHDEIS